MNRREERLDHFIDQLNADQRPSIPTDADRDFVSVAATMHRLYLTRQALAAVPQLTEPQRQPVNLLAAAALALTLIAFLGVAALALRASSPEVDTATDVAIGVTSSASPVWTVVTAEAAPPAWTADLHPIGESQINGGIILLPTGSDKYELNVLSYGMETQRSMTWTLITGTCADAAPATDGEGVLLRHSTSSGVFTLTLPDAWLDAPIILTAHDTEGDALIACADLPVAAARARQPVSESQATNVLIDPEPERDITVNARGWTTKSGDVLLRIEAVGSATDMNLMWYVAEGSCQTLHDPVLRYTDPGRVLYRANALAGSPERHALSIILKREWLEQPLIIGAFGNGGGPLAACGDVPGALLHTK